MKNNFYWAVYKNLEREVIDLSHQINFDDNQLNVYSIKIADLIFRCSTELESIAKDIYRSETEKEPKNAGECIAMLEKEWLINKKHVILSSPYFYFQKHFKPSFAPFDYGRDDPNNYYEAYNAVKHDRVKNINKASINTLVRVMAALYLLNIYYKDDNFRIKPTTIRSDFDSALGSDCFSIKLMNDSYLIQIHKQDTANAMQNTDCYVYLTQYPQNTYENIKKKQEETLQKQKEAMVNSIEFREFLKAGGVINDKNLFTVVLKIGTWYYKNQIMKHLTQEAQLQAIHNSSEYKEYTKHNRKNLEKIKLDDVEALCNQVGYWDYINRVLWVQQKELDYVYFNSQLEVVLNKNQQLYSASNKAQLNKNK
jgi:hypothetical protein